MNRFWTAVPLAVAAVVLTGCSGLGADAPAPQTDAGAPASGVAEDSTQGTPANQAAPIDRDVIRKATVTVVVDDTGAALVSLQGTALASDGYVQSVTSGTAEPPCPAGARCPTGNSDEESVTGIMTAVLRVPAAAYDAVMNDVRGLGEVAALDISADDVTGEVTDLGARINAQRESVARVSQLMKQATNLSEVVRVEQELADRQAELESLVAQRQQLRQSVSLATITALLVPPAQAAQLVPVAPRWWDAPWDAFVSSWRAMLVTLAALSPLLIFGVALAVGVTAVVRRRSTQQTQEQESDSPEGSQPDVQEPVGTKGH